MEWLDEIREQTRQRLADAPRCTHALTVVCRSNLPGCILFDSEDTPYYTGGATLREDRIASQNDE